MCLSIRECTEWNTLGPCSCCYLQVLLRLSGNQALRYCSCTADIRTKALSNHLSSASQKPIKCHTYMYPVGLMLEINVMKSDEAGRQCSGLLFVVLSIKQSQNYVSVSLLSLEGGAQPYIHNKY